MRNGLDGTHDPALRSWVASANAAGADFPIQNLPFGIFRRRGSGERPHVGVAIGDRILDVAACHEAGLFSGGAGGPDGSAGAEAEAAAAVCGDPTLNRLAGLGPVFTGALRAALNGLLRAGDGRIAAVPDWETRLLPPASVCELFLPVEAGDYTDFYASIHHATNVGRQFRPEQPLLPNYKYLPIGYHGRASSLVVSGTPVRRPWGQTAPPAAVAAGAAGAQEAAPSSNAGGSPAPSFGPSQVLDYEVEAGLIIGQGNALGEPIPIDAVEGHFFGVCLLNDWSARDIQKWEYQPLGPFLAKNFATSLSPWIVTWEALAPFRAPSAPRPAGDPAPLAHLDPGPDAARAALDILFELFLSTPDMRARGLPPARISRARSRDLYWTPGQLLAHHASNGCNLRPGDVLGTGTISGPEEENMGCLLEKTRGGKQPIALPNGESRRFLQDGDEVILAGYCEAPGFVRIGLGECRGVVLPAKAAG
ncbi:MAG: fumarylacetoacetase [Fibrobacteres bacterium]|nr:fumarylacetoacetase [Fibrobacterota bacterium]